MSTDTVTIGCKLPNGLLLSVEKDGKVVEHRVNGWNASAILGSTCGFTDNVPKELWEEWLKKFKDSKVVKNGLIFAQSSERKAQAEAKEKEDVKSGKEQIKQHDGKDGKLQKADKA